MMALPLDDSLLTRQYSAEAVRRLGLPDLARQYEESEFTVFGYHPVAKSVFDVAGLDAFTRFVALLGPLEQPLAVTNPCASVVYPGPVNVLCPLELSILASTEVYAEAPILVTGDTEVQTFNGPCLMSKGKVSASHITAHYLEAPSLTVSGVLNVDRLVASQVACGTMRARHARFDAGTFVAIEAAAVKCKGVAVRDQLDCEVIIADVCEASGSITAMRGRIGALRATEQAQIRLGAVRIGASNRNATAEAVRAS